LSIENRLGLPISEIKNPKFISIPVNISSSTEGMPDLFEYKLKKYDKIIVEEKIIIRTIGSILFIVKKV